MEAGVPLITIRFDGNGAPEVLKAAKREVKKRMKKGMADAAQDTVLPKVLAAAPSIVRPYITVKGAVKGPKLTTKGPRRFDNITGLLNFGGTVATTIKPVASQGHQALSVGNGVFRARVYTPRKITGRRFIEAGVVAGFSAFENQVLESVLKSFDGIAHNP